MGKYKNGALHNCEIKCNVTYFSALNEHTTSSLESPSFTVVFLFLFFVQRLDKYRSHYNVDYLQPIKTLNGLYKA